MCAGIQMSKMWKTLAALLLIGMVLGAQPASAKKAGLDAVNQAGYQRMLSQRIVKAYCQIGIGVMPDASRTQLALAVKTYGQNLEQLRTVSTDRKSAGLLRELGRQWEPFRIIASGPVTRAGAGELVRRSAPLLATAEQLTQALQDSSGIRASRLVNLAGRQRMLSQKLAMYYMLHAWGFDTALVNDEIEATRNAFSSALEKLIAAPENTPAIRTELDAVSLQWDWLQAVLALEGALSYRLVVEDASESILAQMDRITLLYQNLPARRPGARKSNLAAIHP
jgi:hypothetical protein